MNTCLKVGLLVLAAMLFCAGAAQACTSGDCLFPGLDQPKGPAAGGKQKSKPGIQLACESEPCGNRPDLEGTPPPAAGGKQKSKPGIQLACDSYPCPNRPDLEGFTPPAAGGKQKSKPGIQLACLNPDCLSPGLQDERLAAQALRRKLLVCIAETCGLTPGLADIMLSCYNENCFAPVPEAEGRAVR
jgi:hypothetical protein